MRIKRFTAIAVSIIMLLAALPVSAPAEALLNRVYEKEMHGLLISAWAYLKPVESEAKALGASKAETVLAVYNAASRCPLIDSGSMSDLRAGGFFFKVRGMACIYDYEVRNTEAPSAVSAKGYRLEGAKNGPAGPDVLQIMPYYLVGAAFAEELCDAEVAIGTSVAEATGGSYTLILNTDATAMRIAEEIANAGVVIINSHGLSYNNTTYICLTTDEGLTSLDFMNCWAAYLGDDNDAGIDGRYLLNHVPGSLKNCIIWLNMCEGMALSGCGVTPEALLEAGAGCVFGYSRNTYVRWDVLFAESFWNSMEAGATVGEAFDTMTQEVCECIEESGAWPVLVSPLDPFPEEPDSHQTVYCDWRLFGEYEPEAPTSYSLSAEHIDVQHEGLEIVSFNRYPAYSQDYELEWRTEDDSIATVIGNNCAAIVQAVSVGETTVCCDVYVSGEYRSTCSAGVRVMPPISEVLNVSGGELSFFTSGIYPWKVALLGDEYAACSGNANENESVSYLNLSGYYSAGDVLSFRMRASSEPVNDTLGFYVNGQLYGELLSGDTGWVTVSYTISAGGNYLFQWRYVKNFSKRAFDDCGYLADVALVHPAAVGDVDGDLAVTANDALMVLRYSLSLIPLSPAQLAAADADLNGTVNSNDALRLLRIALNII